MEISILTSVLTLLPQKKLTPLPRSAMMKDVQNQEYQFKIPKSGTWAEKREEEEEHRQLQSVMRFMQMQ